MCLCDRANSPAPGSGRAWAPHINLFCGPGLDILVAGRAGPGPHNSICGPGPGRVFTTAAGPGRAWASNHICGPGLGLDFRPVQDTSLYVSQSLSIPLLPSIPLPSLFLFPHLALYFIFYCSLSLQNSPYIPVHAATILYACVLVLLFIAIIRPANRPAFGGIVSLFYQMSR